MYRGQEWTGTFDRAAETAEEEERRKAAEAIALQAERERAGVNGIRPEDLGGVGARVMAAGEAAAIPRGRVTLPGPGDTREMSPGQAMAALNDPIMLAMARQKEYIPLVLGETRPAAPTAPMEKPQFLSAEGVPFTDLSREKPGFDMADRNDNGIPDGAERTRTVTREGPNGEQIRDRASWVQKQRVQMGLEAPSVGGENPFTGRTITTAEEALGARRDMLQKRMDSRAIMPGNVQRTTGAELAGLNEEMRKRARDREYKQNVGVITDRLASKEDKALQGTLARAEATKEAARLAGTSRETVAGTKAAADLAKTEAQNANRLAVTGLLNEGKLAEANTRALSDKTVAEINVDADKAVAELNRQGKTEAANILSQNRFKVDPFIWLESSDKQRKMIIEKILTSGSATTTPAAAAGNAPAEKPPMAGKTVGQSVRDKQTGRTWTWNGTDWT
jgi:hypothetical protein